MTPEDTSGNGSPPVEVAIIGAGPVGLMTAMLGLAGIHVLVLERNAGLLGLPRAIAYDAETLLSSARWASSASSRRVLFRIRACAT